MGVLFADSTAAGMFVNGGAITMSQSLTSNTSGFTAAKNARVSADVLYIFQFPAMTRRRFGVLIYLSGPPRPGASYRLETRATLRRPSKYVKSAWLRPIGARPPRNLLHQRSKWRPPSLPPPPPWQFPACPSRTPASQTRP